MKDIAPGADPFVTSFESATARLQICIEEACRSAPASSWPAGVAAATKATLAFAADDPATANLLTNEAIARPRGRARYERLMDHLAERLKTGRGHCRGAADLADGVERALIGGISFLIARRLEQGREDELPDTAPDVVEFILTPFLGEVQARRIAATS